MQYYTLKLCGLSRQLPLSHISKKTRLAVLSILGDVEFTNILADTLAAKLKKEKFDYLVAPAVNVLPLVHGVALRLKHKRFVVCHKLVQPYMVNPIILKPLPHFPKHVKQLILNGSDAKLIRNKKVIIMDDVVSTGVTMRMMTKLMEKVNAQIIRRVTVLKQGKQFEPIKDLIYLGELPIFKKITKAAY